MQSRHISKKKEALLLRSEGVSVVEIEKKLSVPHSTLSGWFKKIRSGMGNSDPLILKFFIRALKELFEINTSALSCDLHLRADQDPEDLKRYWSRELGIHLERFKSVSFDKRTAGRPTYADYKGVCSISCGNIAVQRKLVYLSRMFCEMVVNN